MLQISKRRLAGLGALMTLVALPSTATAAPKTHVFKMDLTVNVSTEWVSHSENSVCSDWNRVLHGEGAQHLSMKAQRRLVTFRGGKLAYPDTKGTMKVRGMTFAPLKGTITRRAAYTLTGQGAGESCAPGWGPNGGDDQAPSTATCGQKPAKGGFYGLVPAGGTLKLLAMSLADDPFGGECPAESSAAITLPEPVTIYHGKDALKQLANPRVKKVVVQGQSEDIETDEPWGMGETHWGTQTSDVLWYATFHRVGR
jgi:hypothetical protein